MIFKRFFRLTQDEFVLLQGTEKMQTMLSNKWFTDSHEVVEFLEEHATGSFCAVPYNDGFILYLESVGDVLSARQISEPESELAPAIHSINIVDETKY
tara:strand:+ start:1099 stop:1392 length:294 start_codon:yes stop_codon:yes gene_type:complete